MALPKLEVKTYNLTLPSTGEEIKYRPFLVKEQKTLLLAQESKKDDEMMLYSGVLERVVHNQLFFVVSHTVVEYKTSLGSGNNWRKKTIETGSAKHTKVVREKDFHYVYKIDEKTDLKVNQKGVNFDSVSYYFYGSGSTVLNSRDSKSCLIVDQKKRISKELECKYDLRRTDPNLKKSVRFADIIHPEKIRQTALRNIQQNTRPLATPRPPADQMDAD